MSTAFESISQGLKEAIDFADGRQGKAVVHHLEAPDIKRIRTDIGMTQTQFAATFGISVSTLRHWERGDRTPHGPALTLLNVLAREPRAVMRALSGDTSA
ncbi:MAG: helix-turn-helix domain-containing protein [Pseudomonadota bacterium]